MNAGYLRIFSLSALIFASAIISITLIYSLYRVNRTAPMAIISPRGIWIKQFDIIPWSNILEVKAFLAPDAPSVGIQVRDTNLLSKQASIAGRLIILESRILHCPTIVIDNLELDNQTIIDFASQFIAKTR